MAAKMISLISAQQLAQIQKTNSFLFLNRCKTAFLNAIHKYFNKVHMMRPNVK